VEQGGGYSKAARQPSGPEPTVATAFGAFDLDRFVRVVGERVVQAHQFSRPLAPVPAIGAITYFMEPLWGLCCSAPTERRCSDD